MSEAAGDDGGSPLPETGAATTAAGDDVGAAPTRRAASVLSVASLAVRNGRRRMEDRSVSLDDLGATLGRDDWDQVYGYYGVFDGHSGTLAATFCAAHLHECLAESPHFPQRPHQALADAFLAVDRRFCEAHTRSGSTAVVALVSASQLNVAWAGDCQAVLSRRGGPALPLVRPHKPDRDDERQRVEQAGGFVECFGVHRVNGVVAVARSIGDVELKPYLVPDADVTQVELDGTEQLLLLASDGIWDVFTPQEAIDLVERGLASPDDAEEDAGKSALSQLQTEAVARGSTDNISVIVVQLRPGGDVTDSAAAGRPGVISSTDVVVSDTRLHVEGAVPSPAVEFDIQGEVMRVLSGRAASVGLQQDVVDAVTADDVLQQADGLSEADLVEDDDDDSSSDDEVQWKYVDGAGVEEDAHAPQAAAGKINNAPDSPAAEDSDGKVSTMNGTEEHSSPLNPDAPVFHPIAADLNPAAVEFVPGHSGSSTDPCGTLLETPVAVEFVPGHSGPSTDPCGTPAEIQAAAELGGLDEPAAVQTAHVDVEVQDALPEGAVESGVDTFPSNPGPESDRVHADPTVAPAEFNSFTTLQTVNDSVGSLTSAVADLSLAEPQVVDTSADLIAVNGDRSPCFDAPKNHPPITLSVAVAASDMVTGVIGQAHDVVASLSADVSPSSEIPVTSSSEISKETSTGSGGTADDSFEIITPEEVAVARQEDMIASNVLLQASFHEDMQMLSGARTVAGDLMSADTGACAVGYLVDFSQDDVLQPVAETASGSGHDSQVKVEELIEIGSPAIPEVKEHPVIKALVNGQAKAPEKASVSESKNEIKKKPAKTSAKSTKPAPTSKVSVGEVSSRPTSSSTRTTSSTSSSRPIKSASADARSGVAAASDVKKPGGAVKTARLPSTSSSRLPSASGAISRPVPAPAKSPPRRLPAAKPSKVQSASTSTAQKQPALVKRAAASPTKKPASSAGRPAATKPALSRPASAKTPSLAGSSTRPKVPTQPATTRPAASARAPVASKLAAPRAPTAAKPAGTSRVAAAAPRVTTAAKSSAGRTLSAAKAPTSRAAAGEIAKKPLSTRSAAAVGAAASCRSKAAGTALVGRPASARTSVAARNTSAAAGSSGKPSRPASGAAAKNTRPLQQTTSASTDPGEVSIPPLFAVQEAAAPPSPSVVMPEDVAAPPDPPAVMPAELVPASSDVDPVAVESVAVPVEIVSDVVPVGN